MKKATKLVLQRNTQNVISNLKMAFSFRLNIVYKNPEGNPKVPNEFLNIYDFHANYQHEILIFT